MTTKKRPKIQVHRAPGELPRLQLFVATRPCPSPRATRAMSISTTRLRIPLIYRNVPATEGVDDGSVALEGRHLGVQHAGPGGATPGARANTTVKCPSEKQNPTLVGRCPSCISLRVVLCITAISSSSNPWGKPSRYAVQPSPASIG